MPESSAESPQLVRDQHHVAGIAMAFFTMPTLAVLIFNAADEAEQHAKVLWFAGSAIVGLLLPFLYYAPYRALGIVPLAALAWVAATAHSAYWREWPAWAHALPLGLIVGAIVRGWRGPPTKLDIRRLSIAPVVGFAVAIRFYDRAWSLSIAEIGVLVLSLLLLADVWTRLFRPLFEFMLEIPFWTMYRLRWVGPGFANFPKTGPCLVIANHACWLDPIFLAGGLPRPTTPMMTARFYDLPVIRRLMVMFGVIRVPEKAIKKDAPEIQEAIAALDRGECVVIFPEGYLRRTEDKPLRRFGQGVWQILKARPDTPIFATWIEGAWGSYTSYFNGRPTKNKRKDFRRPIGLGMSAPVKIPPEELAEHLRTRLHLMNLVSEARTHLGLEPLPRFELLAKADESEAEEEGETA